MTLQEREKKKDISAMRYLLTGLREIDTYRTYLKQHKASLEGMESSEVASKVDKMQDLREGLTSSLTLMRCEDTLRDLDRVTQSLFVSTSETLLMQPFSTLLQHVGDPSLLLRKALILTAEGAWDAQLWSLRMLGCGVSTVHACILSLPARSSHHIDHPLHSAYNCLQLMPSNRASTSTSISITNFRS